MMVAAEQLLRDCKVRFFFFFLLLFFVFCACVRCVLGVADHSAFHVILTEGDSVVSSFLDREVGNALRRV
jgi:Trk-type K+ transport system membrane component